ncbi:hypothetical protein BGW38_009520 [Lunasporangiospora selenospora]|uniref:Uncharacterized protein n=1 Tax=Lunasporangiospora selenospora TaxID=979761 RepID=A0A9P6FZ90_9FUNG|nr:hypothetical protein BGW38_009520 [Lunasporangiospora selenospora]
MRMGLGGSNNIHQSGVRSPSSGSSSSQNDSGNSNSEQTISSEQTSISGTPESSLPTSPVSSRPTSMLVDRASSLGSLGNEMSERHRSPGMMHPVLYRLRSQGPPPYAPLAPEQTASQLPPEYTTTVEISRL